MNIINLTKTLRWMRNHKKLVIFVIVMILIAILASCMGGGSSTTLAVGMLVGGVEGGKHVVEGPLTTDLTHEGSPDLLLNEIDQQIVKIRPMSTPIDQISRYAGSKHAGSMVVDYYSVDTKPTVAQLASEVSEVNTATNGGTPTAVIHTDNDEIFDPTDTILVKEVAGYVEGTDEESDYDLVLYVIGRDQNGVTVMAVNGPTVNGQDNCIPNILPGTELVRMGRAASELDVQSP